MTFYGKNRLKNRLRTSTSRENASFVKNLKVLVIFTVPVPSWSLFRHGPRSYSLFAMTTMAVGYLRAKRLKNSNFFQNLIFLIWCLVDDFFFMFVYANLIILGCFQIFFFFSHFLLRTKNPKNKNICLNKRT